MTRNEYIAKTAAMFATTTYQPDGYRIKPDTAISMAAELAEALEKMGVSPWLPTEPRR